MNMQTIGENIMNMLMEGTERNTQTFVEILDLLTSLKAHFIAGIPDDEIRDQMIERTEYVLREMVKRIQGTQLAANVSIKSKH